MADNYLSGLTGAVQVNGVAFSFGKWKLSMKTKKVVRNNFTSGGFQALVKGFTDGTITCSGPYNQGNMPLVSGNFYPFTLVWNAGINIAVTAMVTSLEPDNDAEDGPNVSITAESSGPFTAAIT